MKTTPTKKKPMTELAKKNRMTPAQKKKIGAMAKAFVKNLNKNVREGSKSEMKTKIQAKKKKTS